MEGQLGFVGRLSLLSKDETKEKSFFILAFGPSPVRMRLLGAAAALL